MKIVPDAPVADKPAAPAADKPPLPAQPQTSDRPRAGSRLFAKLRALVIPIAVLLFAVGIVVLITTRGLAADQHNRQTMPMSGPMSRR